MADIVRKWLITRLQKVPDLSTSALGASCSDGHLMARILYSYEIITSEQMDEIFSCRNEISNVGKLSIWLQFIGITLTDAQIEGILNSKSSVALSVLYEMYLALADKDRTAAVLKNIQRQLYPRPTQRFSVKRTESPKKLKFENPLAQPLITSKALIDKCKSNQNNWKTNIQIAKKKLEYPYEETCYERVIKERSMVTANDQKSPYDKWREEMLDYELKFCCLKKTPDYNYCQLLEMKKKSEEMMSNLRIDPEKGQEFIKSLKTRTKRNKSRKILEQRIKSWIIEDFCNATEKLDNVMLNNEIAEKLQKQSQFEKQISTQVKEIENIREVENETDKIINELACSLGGDSDIILQDLKREKDYDNENIKMEKDRNWDLHKRLYAEKLRVEHQHVVNICEGTICGMIDLALRVAEYHEQTGEEISSETLDQWKSLLIHGLPIFDPIKDTEDIVGDIEEIINLELQRQEIMNEHDFYEYHLRQNVWNMQNCMNSEEDISENDGMLVVGHVVHTLLQAKYTEKPPNPTPDIPKVDICSVLIGVGGSEVLQALQILLRNKKIKMVDAVEVINYCFCQYRLESRAPIEEEYLPRQPLEESEGETLQEIFQAEKAQQEKGKTAKGAKKSKGPPSSPRSKSKSQKEKKSAKTSKGPPSSPRSKSKSQKGKKSAKKSKGPPSPPLSKSTIHKETQTPIEIPQEVILSESAQLGLEAYQCLVDGGTIPDKMYTNMVIEYLKTLTDFNGWCLIGFPETLEQAYVFETIMTGKEPELGLCLYDSIPEREIDKKITSKLLPNPHPRERPADLPTILTSYVNIIKYREEELPIEKVALFSTTDKIINFYLNQGVYYDQYYTCFDVSTVKKIAKLIIGDYSLPWKTSEELFGFQVGVEEPNPFYHPEKPERSDHGSYGVDVDIFERIPDGMVMDVRNIEVEEEIQRDVCLGREYVNEPAPTLALVTLATMWENTECTYINEITQLMFARRNHFVATPLYIMHMRKHMQTFIARPALNQDYVYEFQRQYNEQSPDLRSDDEVKAELHCRLAELYNVLMQLCETRMNQSLEERTRIMCLNWPADEMTFLTNVFISAMQLEMDRTYDTYQIMSDFYIYMLQKTPSSGKQNKSILDRMTIDPKDNTECHPDVAHVRSVMLEIFLMRNKVSTPMDSAIDIAYQTALKSLNENYETFLKAVLEAGKPPPTPKDPKNKSNKKKKKQKKQKKGKVCPPLDEILNLSEDPEITRKREMILKEAKEGFVEESLRASARLQLLQCRAKDDLLTEFQRMQTLYDYMLDTIINRFEQEKQSVIRLCEVLAAAIEREERIQTSLLLEDGGFIVEPSVLFFPSNPPPPPAPIEEPCPVNCFKVGQLGKLKDIFMAVSPDGVMPERAFTYLLADLISLIKIDSKKTLPSHWAQIEPIQLPTLVQRIFGKVEGVSWKDFILYNLEIDFPTEDELLAARQFFREHDSHLTETVTRIEYANFKYWWERKTDDRREIFRYFLIRELLFCLYEVEPDVMNYTALLLGCCKDNDPKLGLAKAFLLCLGQKICWDKDKGLKYEEKVGYVREQLRLEEESRQKAAKDGYDKAVEISIQVAEGVFIKEFHDTATIINPIVEELNDMAIDEIERMEEEENEHELLDIPNFSQEEESEEMDMKTPEDNILYEICFTPAFKIISAAVPWCLVQPKLSSSRTLKCGLQKAFKEINNYEGKIHIYQLLDHEFITELLTEVNKFKVIHPICIVANILGLKNT